MAVQDIWAEKFRPRTIEQCILPERLKNTFLEFVKNGDFPNIILSGSSGTGKTTCARALCEQLNYEYIMINASNERNIDTLRTTVANFASTRSISGKPKAIIFDEFDNFNAMPALRGMIEEFKKVKFIFTCNFLNKIMDAIQSRVSVIEFNILSSEEKQVQLQLLKELFNILDSEGIQYEKQDVAFLLKTYFPDNRRIINEMHRFSSSKKLDISGLKNEVGNFEQLIGFLKNKEFSKMRKWVEDNKDMDFSLLVQKLYNYFTAETVKSQSIPQAIIIINDYETKLQYAINRDIHTAAMLTTLMADVEFK